jgi:hypothetical protein
MRVGPHYATRYYEAALAPGAICYLATYHNDECFGVVCREIDLQPAGNRIATARAFRLIRGTPESQPVRLGDGEFLYASAPSAAAAAAQIADTIRAAFGYRLVNLREDEDLQQFPTLYRSMTSRRRAN